MRELDRREFLRLCAGAAAAAAILQLPACSSEPPAVGPELPGLGGAPDSHEGRTIAAFCDTIVPGRHRDPTGAPGALDTGAVGAFFDPALPAAAFVPTLVGLLDLKAQDDFDRRFVELVPAERDDLVARLLADFELLDFAVQLAKLSYYTSPEAMAHLGYPGANEGYVNHPDFSLVRAVTREITPTGNLP